MNIESREQKPFKKANIVMAGLATVGTLLGALGAKAIADRSIGSSSDSSSKQESKEENGMPSAQAFERQVTVTPEFTPTRIATPTRMPAKPTAEPAAPAAGPEPGPTVPPTPTAAATAIATSTPEAKKDVPCDILPQEYCSQAQVIDWTSPSGNKMKLIGFNLPAGVPLTMPIEGQVAKVQLPEGGVHKGFEAQIFDPNNPTKWYMFNGDMQFDNMFSLNMKKGGVFGRTQKTGIENAGGHNLLFYIIQGSGRNAVIAEDELREMFPAAFTKPAVKASAAPGSQSNTVITKTFQDTAPK